MPFTGACSNERVPAISAPPQGRPGSDGCQHIRSAADHRATQYNPDSVSRTLQIQGVGPESGDRSELLRLKGPPIETWKVDAELDATDQLEIADSTATDVGLKAQLATLELIAYPNSAQLQNLDSQAQSGILEVAAVEAPLSIFVWSKQRIMPVRLTDFSITEEAFDPNLNPIRAKVSLGIEVLNVNDTGFANKAEAFSR